MLYSAGVTALVITRLMVLSIFVMVLAFQNISILRTVHAFTGDVCSCGCEDDGSACDTNCCSTESLSQCDCSEPHDDVVVFILPGSLDNYLQTDVLPGNVYLQMTQSHEYDSNLYKSLFLEPPSPIPIV